MSLVGWWPLDGNANDRIGGNHGSGSPNYVDGKLGRAYDANSGNIDFGNSKKIQSTFQGEELTIVFWWRQNSNQSAWNDNLNKGSHRIEHGRDDYNNAGAGPGHLTRLYDIDGNYHQVAEDTFSNISQGEWFHFVIRKNSEELSAWVNGEKRQTTDGNFSLGSYESNDLTLGNSSIDDYIDDLRLYDHALSKKQIKQLSRGTALHYKMNSLGEGPTTNLIPDYNLVDGASYAWRGNNSSETNTKLDSSAPREEVVRLVKTGTDNQWHGMHGRTNSVDVATGDTITYSGYYRLESSASKTGLSAKNWITGDWSNAGSDGITMQNDGNWHRFKIPVGVTSNTSITPGLQWGYSTSQQWCEFSQVQIEERESATPFVVGSRGPDVVLDSTGYGHNGTRNGATFSRTSGIGFGAYDFDGLSDYVYYPFGNLPGEYTICSWVKTSTDGSISGFSDNLPTGGSHEKEMYIENGTPSFRAYDGSTEFVNGSTRVDDSSWHHVAATAKDNGSARIYVDGVEEDSNGVGDLYTGYSTGNFTIGIGSHINTYFDGKIADTRIYTTELSASEVQSLYEQRGSISNGGTVHGHMLTERVDAGMKLEAYSRGNDS